MRFALNKKSDHKSNFVRDYKVTELPVTISVSKNAYRMATSMCRRTSHEGEESDKKEKSGKAAHEKPFSTLTQVFLIATALGIIRDKHPKPVDSAQLIRGEALRRDKNYECFKQLIKSKCDVKTEAEVANLMAQFAEYGITELYDEFHKTGEIDFVRLSKLGISSE
jgi:hypothetical protein